MTRRTTRVLALSVLVVGSALLVPAGAASGAVGPPAFVSTWGTFGTGPGQFIHPSGVAVDGAGNVYVADTNSFYDIFGFGNNRIEEFTSSGSFLYLWDSAGLGQIYLGQKFGLAVDGPGNLFVADLSANLALEIPKALEGPLTNFWYWFGSYNGNGGSQPGSANGQFNGPGGIAVDGAGNVYVADTLNNRIEKFTSTGAFVRKWGSPGLGGGQFNTPVGIAVDGAGNVYVADSQNNRIEKFTSSGGFLRKWGSPGGSPSSANGQFNHPVGIAVDDSGNVYVADSGNNRIQEFNSSGAFLTKWGSYGMGPGQFEGPTGVAVDSLVVYVADSYNNRIQKFSYRAPNRHLSSAPTRTMVASSVKSSVYGQAVTFTATIALGDGTNSSNKENPTGTVTFYDGSKRLDTENVSGNNTWAAQRKATFKVTVGGMPTKVGPGRLDFPALAVGTHHITAVYGGDANFPGSTSKKLTEMVKRAPTITKLVSSVNPSAPGESVTFTATVVAADGGGTPTGSVEFTGPVAGDLNGDGIADVVVVENQPGNFTITATYSGNAEFQGSVSGTVTERVTGAASTAPTSTTTTASPTTTTTTSPKTTTTTSPKGP